MSPNERQHLLETAQAEIDSGSCKAAEKILRPLVAEKWPEALFLYASFSIAGTETEEGFERRHLALVTEAAQLGHPPALYLLGVYYDVGDCVVKDQSVASAWFKKAAEAGYARAMLSHGLDLFHGSNRIVKNREAGLDFIRQACEEGVVDAQNALEHLKT
ncbi:hypothetical protein BCF11_4592 [Collimonas sp. PA-H2]|uniref:tetratricopeptide repeat protein n=1 Tax=Collimonas sp. PA-H2 TaxID=1881062 RepID=UPI000C00606E|nr:sel1 repeat family protein [Collimonas sp. PA-H2]PFH12117.1 hypothetical protein BCF11_4592 [Collimonas sp. PA-H2]